MKAEISDSVATESDEEFGDDNPFEEEDFQHADAAEAERKARTPPHAPTGWLETQEEKTLNDATRGVDRLNGPDSGDYHVVTYGLICGVFLGWHQAQPQVNRISGAAYKRYSRKDDAYNAWDLAYAAGIVGSPNKRVPLSPRSPATPQCSSQKYTGTTPKAGTPKAQRRPQHEDPLTPHMSPVKVPSSPSASPSKASSRTRGSPTKASSSGPPLSPRIPFVLPSSPRTPFVLPSSPRSRPFNAPMSPKVEGKGKEREPRWEGGHSPINLWFVVTSGADYGVFNNYYAARAVSADDANDIHCFDTLEQADRFLVRLSSDYD